jgi:hypothetical protein
MTVENRHTNGRADTMRPSGDVRFKTLGIEAAGWSHWLPGMCFVLLGGRCVFAGDPWSAPWILGFVLLILGGRIIGGLR